MTPLAATMKLVGVMVLFVIASVNVTETIVLKATPDAPFCGDVPATVGAITSGTAPVLKLHEYSAARAFPALSRIAGEIVAV